MAICWTLKLTSHRNHTSQAKAGNSSVHVEEDDQGVSKSRFAVAASLFSVPDVSDHGSRRCKRGSGLKGRFTVVFQKQFDRYCFKDLNESRKMNLLYTLQIRLAFQAPRIVFMELAYSLCDWTKQSLICPQQNPPPPWLPPPPTLLYCTFPAHPLILLLIASRRKELLYPPSQDPSPNKEIKQGIF